MKKRFLPIATAISAAFLLAACSQTDVVDNLSSVKPNTDNNAVSFSTYTAKKGSMRAGNEGNMDIDSLQKYGFGVFAYYTGTFTYGQHQNSIYSGDGNAPTEGEVTEKYPNFMYNQLVEYKNENWTYEPLKYWPNDFANGDVDTQTPNAAQGSGKNGGNVSFFAYAPHVTDADITANSTSGITAMTSKSDDGDPKITYYLKSEGSNVDLLWGTLHDDTDSNVVEDEESNKGVTGNKNAADDTYEKAIEDGKTVAADLNKQKITGKVKFNFIHALAGVGGSSETAGKTDDTNNTTSGFKVILDIDDSDSPSGGTREKFNKSGDTPAVNASEGSYYRTIVTIEEVSIVNSADYPKAGDTSTDEGVVAGTLHKYGKLNLATGKWDFTQIGNDENKGAFEQEIGTNDPSEENTTALELNKAIAEKLYVENNDNNYTLTTWFTNLTDGEGKHVYDYFAISNQHTGVKDDVELNVYEDSNVPPFLLFPGDKPVFRVSVTYVVRQYDDALNGECTYVRNTITKDVIFPVVKINTHYTLVMHLGLTSVKFTAEVDEWSEYEGENPTPTDPEHPGNGNKKEPIIIDLPSNEPNSSTTGRNG